MALNLEKQLLFYGQYHHNPTNIGNHIVGVPLIFFTSLFLGARSPALPIPSALQIPYLPPNACTIAASVYSTLYILLEPVAGALLAPLVLGWAALSNYLVATLPNASPALTSSILPSQFFASPPSFPLDLRTLTAVAIALHVGSWLSQFVGHGVFERRAPALKDNLFQAFFLAPLFVWLEILFAFGYRPELRARVGEAVEKEVHKYRAKAGMEQDKATNGKAE